MESPVNNTMAGRKRSRWKLQWGEIGILFTREMRASLREKTVILNSILLPLILYPFMLWAGFTGITFVAGQADALVTRVQVSRWPTGHSALKRDIERDERVRLVDAGGQPDDAARKIRAGELDAAVEFLPAKEGTNLAGNFEARISYDSSKERGRQAFRRIEEAVHKHREAWLKKEVAARNVTPEEWQMFNLETRNVASGKQMGSFIIGLLLPLSFVAMMAIGCFYPAVDSTAGERERNTWETLMSTAASRSSIVASKYLVVTAFGGLAGVLNLTAMVLALKPILAPLLSRAPDALEFSIPLMAVPVAGIAGLLLAGFVAAGMMIFAAFARTFKEGQAMITPFYLLVFFPVILLAAPGIKLTLPMAFVPVANVMLVIREAVSGTFQWLPITISCVVSLGLIAACIRAITFILQFEDVMMGSYNGSIARFVRERLLKMKTRPAKPKDSP